MSDRGWIKLSRKLTEWEWYANHNTTRLFVHLLLTANYEDARWQGIEVKRGQLITGRKTLSEETGLSEQMIRLSLNKLQNTKEITIKATSKYSIITIVKYNDYQEINQQTTSKETNGQPTNNQQTTTIKEEQEIKNIVVVNAGERNLFEALQDEIAAPIPLNMLRVEAWKQQGADDDLILHTVRVVMAQRKARGDPPPSSMKYFDGAIATSLKAQNDPLPEVKNDRIPKHSNGTAGYRGPTKAERTAAALRQWADSQGLGDMLASQQPGQG